MGFSRIFGVETEFGCLVDVPSGNSESVVEAVKDYIFHEMQLGAIDLHPRDEAFEPAFSGGFLINGGRLYVDAVGSHEEYATPECRSLFDLIASDRAGQRILVRALKELDLQDVVRFYNNSVDHFGGHTFGCHENYLVRTEDRFLSEAVHYLYPFLVTRQIFAGVGRVGGHRIDFVGGKPDLTELARHPVDYIWVTNVYGVTSDPTVKYQLSQRADHIIKTIASRVRFNRALINPKWETFSSSGTTTRLHLLFGEANQMDFAYALKIGSTCLVLDLLEERRVPKKLRLADPLETLKSVSRDETYRWLVRLENGDTISAIDLQREYLRLAERYKGRDPETDWVLHNWRETLDLLEKDPNLLADRLDWVAKKHILELYMQENNLHWRSDALHSIDLEYHNINPSQSLYYALLEMGKAKLLVDEVRVLNAMTEPPKDTRAFGRGQLVRYLLKRKRTSYWVDWDAVHLDRQTVISLPDPFNPYPDIVESMGK